MAGQHGDRGDGLQLVEDHVPIGDARIERIVADEDDRLGRRRLVGQQVLEPANVLRREVPVAHPQDGPLREPDEAEPAAFKGEAVVAPKPGEIRAARFRPFRVVVAGDDVVRDAEAVEDLLGLAEIVQGAHLGDVPGHQDEGQPREGVDVRDRGPEVAGPAVRADMEVAQPGETQRRARRRGDRRGEEAEGEQRRHKGRGDTPGKRLHRTGSHDGLAKAIAIAFAYQSY